MKIPKLILLLIIVFSCKENKVETKVELPDKIQKTEVIATESDSIYERYKLGLVEYYDWNLISERAEKYSSVSEQFSDKDSIPKDFLEFSKRFISDAKFQKKHIDFENLIAVVGACEETYVMSENNWVFDNWNFIENLEIDDQWENTFRFSDEVFFFEFKLKEIGTIRILGFEKQNGIWRLTLYDHSDC